MRRDLALIVTCLAMFCTVRADEEEEEDEDYELELGAWDGWEEVTLEGRQGRESVVITLGELQVSQSSFPRAVLIKSLLLQIVAIFNPAFMWPTARPTNQQTVATGCQKKFFWAP